MLKKGLVVAVAAFFMSHVQVSSAEPGADLSKLNPAQIAEMKDRVSIAAGLIAMGRKDGDAQLIAVGARILSNLKVDVIDPETKRSGKPAAFNARSLVATLAAMNGGEQAAMSVQLSPDYTKPQNYCYWDYECGTFECGWLYIC